MPAFNPLIPGENGLACLSTDGCLRMRRYSACTHITSWMSEVRASAKKMEEKATWYEKLIVEHSSPSNWICAKRERKKR